MSDKLFALVLGLQKPEIEQYCFQDCGKILVGGIDDPDYGAMLPCRVAECPFLEREMDEPFGTVDGQSVYLRKLRPLTEQKAAGRE